MGLDWGQWAWTEGLGLGGLGLGEWAWTGWAVGLDWVSGLGQWAWTGGSGLGLGECHIL